MRRLSFVLVCLVTAFGVSRADQKKPAEPVWPDEEFRRTQPEGGEIHDFKQPPVTQFKLKNGVQVYLV